MNINIINKMGNLYNNFVDGSKRGFMAPRFPSSRLQTGSILAGRSELLLSPYENNSMPSKVESGTK
jgi:hypothetical protein